MIQDRYRDSWTVDRLNKQTRILEHILGTRMFIHKPTDSQNRFILPGWSLEIFDRLVPIWHLISIKSYFMVSVTRWWLYPTVYWIVKLQLTERRWCYRWTSLLFVHNYLLVLGIRMYGTSCTLIMTRGWVRMRLLKFQSRKMNHSNLNRQLFSSESQPVYNHNFGLDFWHSFKGTYVRRHHNSILKNFIYNFVMGLKNVDGAKNRKRRASHDDHLMISSWRGGVTWYLWVHACSSLSLPEAFLIEERYEYAFLIKNNPLVSPDS